MEITGVRVKLNPNLNDSKLKGFAAITFDDSFMVHNIRIIEGNSGLFVAMPDRTLKNGKSVNVAHPVTKETRTLITEKVLEEFENVKAGLSPELGSNPSTAEKAEPEPIQSETDELGSELSPAEQAAPEPVQPETDKKAESNQEENIGTQL